MANGIRTGDPREFNKGRSSKFRVGYRVRETPEEGRKTYRPIHCGNNNKDEDNSPKTLYKEKLFFLKCCKYRNKYIVKTMNKILRPESKL